MAIYAQFDKDGPCPQIASNVGWSEFGDWVETLDGYTRINALWSDGFIEDIPGLRAELEHVLDSAPPTNKDVLSVADGIIHCIDAAGPAEIMMITSGVQIDPAQQPPPAKP